MLNASELVFDEHMIASGGTLPTTATAYAGLVHSEKFSRADQIGIFIAVIIPAVGTGTVEAQIEHCSDGVHWQNKNDTEEINKSSWPGVGEQVVFGGETQPARPTLEFVRLRITLTGFASRVKAYMVGRLKEEPKEACSCSAASSTRPSDIADSEPEGDGFEPPPDPDDGDYDIEPSPDPDDRDYGLEPPPDPDDVDERWQLAEASAFEQASSRLLVSGHEVPPDLPGLPKPEKLIVSGSGSPQPGSACPDSCVSCGSVTCPKTGVCVLSNTQASVRGGQESSIAWNESPDGAKEGITMIFYKDEIDEPHVARFTWSKSPGEPLSWTDNATAAFKPDTGPLAQGGTCAQAQQAAAMTPPPVPFPCGFYGDPIIVAIPAALATNVDAGLVSTPGWFALIALATDPRGKTGRLSNAQNVVMALTTDGGKHFTYAVVNNGNARHGVLQGGHCDRPTAAVDLRTGDVWVQWANRATPKNAKSYGVILVRKMRVRAVLDSSGKPSKATVTRGELLKLPLQNYPVKPGGASNTNYSHAYMLMVNDAEGNPEVLLVNKTRNSRQCVNVAGPVNYGLVTKKPNHGPWKTHIIYQDPALPICVGPGYKKTSGGGLHYPWLLRPSPGLQALSLGGFGQSKTVIFVALVASVLGGGSKVIIRMSGDDRDTWTTILSTDDLPVSAALTPGYQVEPTSNPTHPAPPWHTMPSLASIQHLPGGGQLALSWRETLPGGMQVVRGTVVNIGANGSVGILPAVDLSTTAVPCSTSGARAPWPVPDSKGLNWPGDYNGCAARPRLGDFVCTFADQRGNYPATASPPLVRPSAWVAVFRGTSE